MKLTFDEAIANHRKMWNWIADETEKRKESVTKEEYFEKNEILDDVECNCYCCEYGTQKTGISGGFVKCKVCPIDWKFENCECRNPSYNKWKHSYEWESSAKYARQIANLPERHKKIEC